jgi:hypothetical protein
VLTKFIEKLIDVCQEGSSNQAFKLIQSFIRMNQTEEILAQFNVVSGE